MSKHDTPRSAESADADLMLDASAGAQLFAAFQPTLIAAMVERGRAGGSARDVALGFLGAFGAYVARNVGPNSAQQLFKDAQKILKRASH